MSRRILPHRDEQETQALQNARDRRHTIGYAAMSEQFHPTDMLAWSQLAEEQGFGSVMCSDHFHPWTPEQGQSAFVWTFLGALGQATSLPFCTGVTPPGYRYHPAVLAQAAATVEAMYPGRFTLGVGAGEAINEHVVGGYWPEAPERVERMFEAIGIIQRLFEGKGVRHQGKYFRVEGARLYTLPPAPPPIWIATSGPYVSRRTGQSVDGIITVSATDEKVRGLLERCEAGARETGRDPATLRRVLLLHVSWDATDALAMDNCLREWPNGGMPFPKADIRDPETFQALARMVRPEHFQGRVHVSADPQVHAGLLQHFIDMGFDTIFVHNVGRNQADYIRMMGQEVIPRLQWPDVAPPASAS